MNATNLNPLSLLLSLMISLVGMTASADSQIHGYSISANGVTVETLASEIVNDEERDRAVQFIANEVETVHAQNPNAFFETAYLEVAESGRNPAQSIFSKTRAFIESLHHKLKGARVSPDRSGGLRQSLKDFYLENPKLVWTVVRVSTSAGLRVGTLVYSGVSLAHSLEIALPVAVACTMTSVLYGPINRFAANFRLYHYLKQNTFPKLQSLLQDPSSAKKISYGHQKFNWGLVDTLFGAVVIAGQAGARSALGMDLDLPSAGGFIFNTGASIFSQGTWDDANEKNRKFVEDNSRVPSQERQANYIKYGALGSVASVFGFTAASSNFLPAEIAGYTILATLGAAGLIYNHRVNLKIAEVESCNEALSGSSVSD